MIISNNVLAEQLTLSNQIDSWGEELVQEQVCLHQHLGYDYGLGGVRISIDYLHNKINQS
jgi:hypothetical protein